jgi:HSP20 family molecular chaperone IbpA
MPKQPEPGIFDTLMEDLFGGLIKTEKTVKTTETTTKSYSSNSDDNGMSLNIDLPGIDPKSLTLRVGEDVVVVDGKNGTKTFTHKYTISGDFDVKTAVARWIHGRLQVRLSRKPATQPAFQTIQIEIK